MPAVDYKLIDESDVSVLKKHILSADISSLILYERHGQPHRHFVEATNEGTNGVNIRLSPQKDWEVNDPPRLAKVLTTLEDIQKEFNNTAHNNKQVSLADLIVLGGCAAVEEAPVGLNVRPLFPFIPDN